MTATKKEKIKAAARLNRVLYIITCQGLYSSRSGRIYKARLDDNGVLELQGWHDGWFKVDPTESYRNQRGETISLIGGAP